ncbi:hypothetical protein IF1G_06186 [Cordyceps javanica]|uniref:Uncharacterized protein n=1 Tax=Cordyceps javanica TaxID=43265 RepID=A0A545V0I9_9HYPO|nr:hypothetical protein IF1G_06186 [Cordyceps javanica]
MQHDTSGALSLLQIPTARQRNTTGLDTRRVQGQYSVLPYALCKESRGRRCHDHNNKTRSLAVTHEQAEAAYCRDVSQGGLLSPPTPLPLGAAMASALSSRPSGSLSGPPSEGGGRQLPSWAKEGGASGPNQKQAPRLQVVMTQGSLGFRNAKRSERISARDSHPESSHMYQAASRIPKLGLLAHSVSFSSLTFVALPLFPFSRTPSHHQRSTSSFRASVNNIGCE